MNDYNYTNLVGTEIAQVTLRVLQRYAAAVLDSALDPSCSIVARRLRSGIAGGKEVKYIWGISYDVDYIEELEKLSDVLTAFEECAYGGHFDEKGGWRPVNEPRNPLPWMLHSAAKAIQNMAQRRDPDAVSLGEVAKYYESIPGRR